MKQNTVTAPQAEPAKAKPEYVTALEAAYGGPSQAGFGSAVFYEQAKADDDLVKAALAKYEYFVGELWERWGQDAWMGSWREVCARKSGTKAGIVAELKCISDCDAQLSAPVILDVAEGDDAVGQALAAACDDPAVTDLRVFALGDGEAMSGLLVVGKRKTGETTSLIFLAD